MAESPVATVKANVMLYDTNVNSWIPSGPGQGLSKVQLYHNVSNNAYRVVGWRLQDREVVINCAIVRGLKYQRARQTFHQWRDSKQQVYGLNFGSAEEANDFASAVEAALTNLTVAHKQQMQQQQQQQQPQRAPQVQPGSVPSSMQGQSTNMHGSRTAGDDSQSMYQSSGSQNYDSCRPPSTEESRRVTGSYVDMSRACIVPPSPGGSAQSSSTGLPPSPMQQTVTAEYAYPGQQTAVEPPYTRSDSHNNATMNGTQLTNGTQQPGHGPTPIDSRYYSSSDDSVKGLILSTNSAVPRDAGAPSQICNPRADNSCSPNGSTSPSLTSNSNTPRIPPVPSFPAMTGAPPVPPPPPPPPPPPFATMSNSNTRVGRPLHRSVVGPAPSIQGDGDADEDDGESGGFAAQLRMARQQRTRAASLAGTGTEHHTGGPPSVSGGTRGPGAGDMMSDLQRVLAARRRQKEAEENGSTDGSSSNGTAVAAAGDSTSTRSGSQSAGPERSSIVPGFATLRKHSSPFLDTTSLVNQTGMNGTSPTSNNSNSNNTSFISRADLDAFRRELMIEIRREVQQLKNEVIEALRSSMSRC